MPPKSPSQWRTVGAVVLIIVVNAAVLMFLARREGDVGTQVVKLYESFSFASWMAAAFLCGHSVGQFAAGGGGLKGIANALLTDAKPATPPPPATTP